MLRCLGLDSGHSGTQRSTRLPDRTWRLYLRVAPEVPRVLKRHGRTLSRAARLIRVISPIITAGCAISESQSPRLPAHYLNETEMDRVTVGSARAASSVSAQAIGSTATAFTSTSDLVIASSRPINGAPFLSYATVQSRALAAEGESAQADGAGEIFAGSGPTLGAGANVTAAATATGAGARAQVNVQLYGIVTTDHTALVFGTIDALACCAPHASGQATIDTLAEGPYVAGQYVLRTGTNPGAAESAIDFAVVSSPLPLVDPSLLGAASATRIAPGY